jgi:protein TonB
MVTASRLVALGVLLLAAAPARAQNSYNWWDARPPAPVAPPPRPTRKPAPKPPPPASSDSLPLTSGGYLHVETAASFPGGQEALARHIQKTLKRPPGPRQRGRVLVNLIIAATGEVTKVQVGLSPAYDAAAVACIRGLPKFTPGRRNGSAVAMYLTSRSSSNSSFRYQQKAPNARCVGGFCMHQD